MGSAVKSQSFTDDEGEAACVRTAAKKKETTMSQMTSFWKAMKACWKLRVLVKMVTVTARNAQAPVGKGSKTSPAGESRLCLTSQMAALCKVMAV